ncbi:16S rRNA (cytosine(967)-C(5))-methyltransferase RsmB [Salisediminibacterium halotolerans]|uniref:16S rRNA (cytosine(967)-C(5))-methyltransferase n=1 Tax=Salisediminibacterium halotolerans TaxID=517425 RepID=A0A1H9PXV2_9BACI|nr:16S rRNA (cytosine(967)-C(5))-methyltransferase RsmB [Salisediminibacterium haloalkalitolerans]SER53014.1 16S rRNA (cytosine967-C5)-methyltransferase [Salisediminibacterium haloalkalitolerans]
MAQHSAYNVREAVLDILLHVKKNQGYSNVLIDRTVKEKNLASVDVPLLTEIVYGTIQYEKTLDYYINAFLNQPPEKLNDWVRALLRLSVYQYVYLDRVPDHAIINEAVNIAKKRGHKGISGMVNGMLRSIMREELPSIDAIEDPSERLAVKMSHPSWLIERWIEQFGKEKAAEIAANNLNYPITSARVNTTKTTREKLIRELAEEGVEAEASPLVENAVRIRNGVLTKTAAFHNGYVSLQDEGSMLTALLLNPLPGERILDACAAPGGKSACIAERMNNTGEVISVDIQQNKVKHITEQKKRLGLSIITAHAGDARRLADVYEPESFDGILVDAPCSGFGVIQRKPDIKWAKKKEDIERLAAVQADILDAVWPLLKKGGRLVYSTCTIDLEENSRQVEAFLSRQRDAFISGHAEERLPEPVLATAVRYSEGVQLFAGEFGTDGFFMSLIEKSSG